MADSEPAPVRGFAEGEVWHVYTSPVGDRVHVEPAKGFMSSTRMSMGVDCGWHWRSSYCYPKTEKQLRRAVAACQRECDKLNAKDEAGARLARRVRDEALK